MLAMSAGAASAYAKPLATTACGAACTDVSFVNPGPPDLLGTHSGLALPNNVVQLVAGSDTAYQEDFTQNDVGTVFPIYCSATGQAQTGSLFTDNQCHLLSAAGLLGATTYEWAYNPNNGGDETLCIGGWDNKMSNGWKLHLEPCGVAADTVLIETNTLPGGATSAGDWVINGASDNFSTPLVATSDGAGPFQATWSTVQMKGQTGISTQEAVFTSGPFSNWPLASEFGRGPPRHQGGGGLAALRCVIRCPGVPPEARRASEQQQRRDGQGRQGPGEAEPLGEEPHGERHRPALAFLPISIARERCRSAGLTARARPEAKPDRRAANLCTGRNGGHSGSDRLSAWKTVIRVPGGRRPGR